MKVTSAEQKFSKIVRKANLFPISAIDSIHEVSSQDLLFLPKTSYFFLFPPIIS